MCTQVLRYGSFFIGFLRLLVVGATNVTEFVFLMFHVASTGDIFDQICYIVAFNRDLFDNAMWVCCSAIDCVM